MMNDVEKAKKILSEIMYITIATVTKDGLPWNTPVYAAADEKRAFYWASWQDNQHSRNIRNNPNVFIVVYNSLAPEGTGEGVYIQAKAHEVTDPKEIEHAFKYYYGRKNKESRKTEEFLGEYPRRIYKAIPEKFWVNSDGEVNGNFIDTRIEVNLLATT